MSPAITPMMSPPPPVNWQANLTMRLIDIVSVERFESVGSPADRNLGASIVDLFADDLQRLADA